MRTLDDLLVALFPRGMAFPSVAFEVEGSPSADWDVAPSWPPDAFSYAGKLLDLSGAYHHVSPETSGSAGPRRRLTVTQAERDEAERVGKAWADALRAKASPVTVPPPPVEVVALWAILRAHALDELFVERDASLPPPAWWRAALFLVMMADEAARDLGFEGELGTLKSEPSSALELLMDVVLFLPATERKQGADSLYSCSFANQNVVGVLPKSRTPAVGCTLRSLSHNLALVPPGGEVRVRWLSPQGADALSAAADRPLKILVVPFPYSISAECFEPVDVAAVVSSAAQWGWFHISPKWLGPSRRGEAVRRAAEFADFVIDLVDVAGRDGTPVGAIVLPEAALNETFLAVLFDAVLRRCPDVELLVSGTSESPDGTKVRKGNFVAQAVFFSENGKRQGARTLREKHHRWRLDRGQIETYALGARLNPATLWWEGIEITSRSLDMVTFRPGATMTTLICEDLARVDPCQGAVRSVGPTLLFALLMDGSQLAVRWPGRYATVLAEDPGCSVLTVSSLGLINRSRLPDGSRPRWSVALWRDDTGGPAEMVMQPGHHAISFVVRPEWRTECTLDGRQDRGQALAWRLDQSDGGPCRSVRASSTVPAWLSAGTD